MEPTVAKTTIEEFELPFIVRVLNGVGALLQKSGISPVNLSEASILKNAIEDAGLSDFGKEDFRAPLNLLLDSYKTDSNLSLLGRLAARHECIRLLSNRLKIQSDLKSHPEILQTPIRKPLFIIGLPRTGTTLLHRLLGTDNASRVPLMWEMIWPSPPPTKENRGSDPRIRLAEKRVKQINNLVPQMRAMHPIEPTHPEECLVLFQHNFASLLFEVFAEVPRYSSWLMNHDMVPEYQYYKQQLQLLQWRCPGDHWVLKTPFHLMGLEALLNVFPDACVIQTHRAPAKVFGSLLSLIAVMRKLNSNHTDLKRIGTTWLSTWGNIMDRAMQVREAANPSQFYDVHYHDLVDNPFSVIQKIYAHFNYRFTGDFEAAMKRWSQENPQHKHGVHSYSLEKFGLNSEIVNHRFAAYMDKFNIRPE